MTVYAQSCLFLATGCVHSMETETETERERRRESEKVLPRGGDHAAMPSPLRILGMYTPAPGVFFKQPGSGLKPHSRLCGIQTP